MKGEVWKIMWDDPDPREVWRVGIGQVDESKRKVSIVPPPRSVRIIPPPGYVVLPDPDGGVFLMYDHVVTDPEGGDK